MSRLVVLLFSLIISLSAQEPTSTDNNGSDEKLELMYQVFTYSSDLNNSYKIAKKGVKLYPDSLSWHKRLAKVSVWLDKRAEAIEQYRYIYAKTKNKRMGEKILKYALSSYQYEVAAPILRDKTLENPTRKNIKDMIFLYDQVGTPEIAAQTLVELSNREDAQPLWSLKAMEIYMQLGASKRVEELAQKIEQRASLDIDTTQKLASYYISQKKIPKAYDLLLRTDIDSNKSNSSLYYQQVSDIGWYLQDPKNAAHASKQLFLQGKARQIDIERIIYYYSDLDAVLVQKASHYGSTKFQNRYFYRTYLDTLYAQKRYKELAVEFEKISRDKNSSNMSKESYFWIMRGQTYSALGEQEKAVASFYKALKISHNSPTVMETLLWFYIDQGNAYAVAGEQEKAIESFQEALRLSHNAPTVMETLMWFYIDHKEHKRLKKMIFELEESGHTVQRLWLPLAVGNFALQKPERAMHYIKRLMQAKENDIDIKLMYAYIMQAREEQDTFMKMMREVYTILNKRLAKNSKLMQNKKFLEDYLSVALYFIDADDYEALLAKSKKSLGIKKFIELSIYWSLRHNEYALARYQAHKLATIEPWMQLNIALNSDDRTKQLDLLYKYRSILPIRDRVTTAISVGSISLAQTLAFDGQEDNKYDYLLYQQNRDLIHQHADNVNISLGYHNRNAFDRSYMKIKNRYYIAEAYSLLTNLNIARDKNQDPINLSNLPKEDDFIEIGVKKAFDRGNLELLFGWRSAVESYFTFATKLHYRVMSRVEVDMGYYNNAQADETTYLLFGGKKDGVSTKVSLQYLPSSTLSLSLFYNRYYSQDDHYLGDGYYVRAEWYRQLHSGYPDIAIGAFADYGRYNDLFDKKFSNRFDDQRDKGLSVLGSLGKLMPFRGRVLPEEFYNIGVNFFYGMMNKQYYTRVWRPYAEISPYYNGYSHRFNFSFGAGYGGSLHGQDHLTIGFDYDQSVNGTTESNFRIYTNYRIFY